MKPGSLASRVERLEQQIDPKPEVILVWLRDGETKEAARARAIVEHGVKPSFRAFVFCDESDINL